MVTYGNDQNGLWLKFDNFTSNDIRQIEYINNVLYVTNYSTVKPTKLILVNCSLIMPMAAL